MSITAMRGYLSRSIASLNRNKLRGLLAEVEFRRHLHSLGFDKRVSVGGWIARSDQRAGRFGANTVVFFPHVMDPAKQYPPGAIPAQPRRGLHTICATFRQLGIRSYYCSPVVPVADNADAMTWLAQELGIPDDDDAFAPFPDCITGFGARTRREEFLGNNADLRALPDPIVPEEFCKEHARVTFSLRYMSEIADLDGLFWGKQHTYPLEIKEKTVAGVARPEMVINGQTLKKRSKDSKVGPWFGIDIGPFTKLAFFAAKKGNLHSLFVVREIDNEIQRNHVQWWFTTFDQLAQFAGWNYSGGGQPMTGGTSSTIKVPRDAFSPLTKAKLDEL